MKNYLICNKITHSRHEADNLENMFDEFKLIEIYRVLREADKYEDEFNVIFRQK